MCSTRVHDPSRLPEITALQFVVLSLLLAGEQTGRQLRHEVQKWHAGRSPAAFSQLMTRLTHAAYVHVDWHADDAADDAADGQAARVCRYRVTDLGLIVWQAARRFYAGFDPPRADLQPMATDEAQFAGYPAPQRRAMLKKTIAKTLLRNFQLSHPALRQ